MKIKARELEGSALDWAVAKAEGVDEETLAALARQYATRFPSGMTPTTSWNQAGLLIERFSMSVIPNIGDQYGEHERWHALMPTSATSSRSAMGPTPLVAAMRALVFARLGDEVEIPDELAA